MQIAIYEDAGYENLQPLTYNRPTFDLRCGMYLLREKIERVYARSNISYFIRDMLKDFFIEKNPGSKVNSLTQDDYLFLNGRVLFSKSFLQKLNNLNEDKIYAKNGVTIAAFVTKHSLSDLKNNDDGTLNFHSFNKKVQVEEDVTVLNYPWDLIHENPDQIAADFALTIDGTVPSIKEKPGVYLINSNNIWISDSAQIDPCVVIDAEEGPVYIDDDVHIFPQSTIIGPAYIGKKSLIKIGAKIYEGTSIGEVCKIGGEVEESIIHSYSNKQHDGFLGHAYIGQWVNIGAGTNNSDLKNNYGSVRVYINGKEIDSGSKFVGLTLGDHSKSGIGTMFNTGTIAGIMCNLYGSDFLPKWIPSFSWGGSEGLVEYNLDKALEVAKRVMGRRKVTLGHEEEKLIRKIFEQSKEMRK
jgi:UDP-N-acetylglucosamine diphosphorylase/glucosamine-1-phosphate N-acetyltransferase